MAFLKDLLNGITRKPDVLFIMTDKITGNFIDYVFNKKGEPPDTTLHMFLDRQLNNSKQNGYVADNNILKFDLKNINLLPLQNTSRDLAESIYIFSQKGNLSSDYSFNLIDAAFAVFKNINLKEIDNLSILSNGLLKQYEDYDQFCYIQKQLSSLYKDNLFHVKEAGLENSIITLQNNHGKQESKKYLQEAVDGYFTNKKTPDYHKISLVSGGNFKKSQLDENKKVETSGKELSPQAFEHQLKKQKNHTEMEQRKNEFLSIRSTRNRKNTL